MCVKVIRLISSMQSSPLFQLKSWLLPVITSRWQQSSCVILSPDFSNKDFLFIKTLHAHAQICADGIWKKQTATNKDTDSFDQSVLREKEIVLISTEPWLYYNPVLRLCDVIFCRIYNICGTKNADLSPKLTTCLSFFK